MKRVYVELLVLIFHFITSCLCNSGELDVDALIIEYSNACGHVFLCSELDASSYPAYHPQMNRCPKCSCDDDCFSTKTCCPDKFFKSKFQVFTNFLIGSADRETYQKYEVIVSCPAGTNPSLKAECETSLAGYQWTKTPPVTSLATNFSYSNKYCASCHGEALNNLDYWDLGFGQGDLPNIVYLSSSYKELIRFGDMLQIPVLFTPSQRANHLVNKLPTQYLLPSTCPTDTDHNIKKACESSYFLPFRFYQNIFCYMCNIPKISNADNIITTCNVTGHWDAKDLSLRNACANKGTSAMTFPYKNAYCFFCNTIANPLESFSPPPPEGRKVIHFHDIYFEYEERHSVNWLKKEKHEIKIKNVVFKNEKMNLNILNKKIKSTDIRILDKGMYRWKEDLIDITSLVQRKVAMHPDRVCDLSLLPESIRQFTLQNCDCDFDCVFRNVCSCCVDIALQSSATCLSNTIHADPSSKTEEVEIIVIDGCSENEGYMYYHQYRKLCEEDTGDFSSYFVQAGSATYKNVFCFFCNKKIFRLGQELLHNKFTPLDLNIVCPFFFHFLYAGSIKSVISSAKTRGCSVYFDTDKTTKCRKEEDDYFYGGGFGMSLYSYYDYSQSGETKEIVNVCNSSGNVVNDIDLNVRWACENISDQAFPSVSGFKNEFCLLCNVNDSVQTSNAKCDSGSVNFHPAYSEGCLSLPDVHAVPEVYPYKNSFCFACNNELCADKKCLPNSTFVIDPSDCSGQTGNALKIRGSFILSKLLPSVVFYASPQYVTESEGYGCFPGRVLVADVCELIIIEGIGSYAVDISTKITVNTSIANATIVFQKIERALKLEIRNLLPGNPGLIGYFSVLPDKNLELEAGSPIPSEQFNMDIYFEVPYFLYDRELVEKMLLKLPYEINQQSTIENENVEYHIKGLGFSFPKRSLDNSMSDTVSYNRFKNRMQSLFAGPPLTVLFVGNLLFCVHRKYNVSVFNFDYENLRITSNETLLGFEMGDFVLDFAGFVGVCDYGSRYHNTASDKLVATFVDIHYLSTVFHGVSTISTASIFLTYCIFSNLRTPSGINAMFVSLSMSLFHLMNSMVKLLEHVQEACTVLGLILHYLWLSVCCSLSVAAFHQFLLFKNYEPKNDLSSDSTERSPVLFHVILNFLLPLLVVGVNSVLLYIFSTDIQYDSEKCFLTHEISNIVTFLSPLAISTLLTLFLYFATFKIIISSREKINLKRKRTEFFLLFRIAIIASVIIFLQISEWFINTSTYSFVVDLIVSTQGCTIFLAVCCSSQIFKLWKTKGENLSDSDSTGSLETEKATTAVDAE